MAESASELSATVDAENVIEGRRADRALQESEERYRLLFERSPIGTSITTPDGSIVEANRALCVLLGYSEDELKKIRVADLYEKPERRDALLEAFKRDGAASDFPARIKHKDGSSFDAVMNVSRIHVRGKNLLQTTVQDVTERRKMEETLRRSEEKYRNLFENAQDTILTYDSKGIISSVNRKAEDYGFRKDHVIGKNMLKFIPKKYWPRLIKEHSDIARGNPTEGEIEVITPMGNITVEYRSNPIRQGERVIGAQTIMRDVTDRKKAEETIRESEEKFRSIFEGVADGIIYLDKFGKILDANRKALEIFGGSREELLGKRFTEIGIFSFKETLTLMGNLGGILRGKKTVINVEIKNKNSQAISLECSTSLLKTGDRTMIAAVFRDVSERKRMEENLRQNEQKFRSLFERSPEALAYVNSKLEILGINPSFTELFGYTREEAKSKDLDSLIVPTDKKDEAEELSERAIEGNVHQDTVRKTKNGSLVPVSVSAAPITEKGVLTSYIAVYKDISHLKKAEEALTTMNEKLRVIGGLTRHDARNRLSLVTTNAYLAKECLAGNIEAKGYLGKIEGAINDVVGIFDFAKIYEMLGVEKPTYVDVEKTVNEAVSLFPALKTVKVAIDCHGLTVLADSLLRQAFYNLIDDSIKYARNLTQIKVYYERVNNDHLRLVYEDDGGGIPLDKKPMLFQRGYTSGKGSGYGLYLIQKMMEIYEWTIRETGEPGKGACFVMDIPKLNKEGKELYQLDTEA